MLQFLGEHSMAIYMLHHPLLQLVLYRGYLHEGWVGGLVMVLACISLTLTLSQITKHVVERPVSRWLQTSSTKLQENMENMEKV